MNRIFLLSTILFGSVSLPATVPEVAVFFQNGETRVQAFFLKEKRNFKTELKLPNGKTVKGEQSFKSIAALKKELAKTEEGPYRKECSRQHIVFAVTENRKTKNFSTCIGARNKQALAIANLFNVTYATLLK